MGLPDGRFWIALLHQPAQNNLHWQQRKDEIYQVGTQFSIPFDLLCRAILGSMSSFLVYSPVPLTVVPVPKERTSRPWILPMLAYQNDHIGCVGIQTSL
jgi:hypothetical protein